MDILKILSVCVSLLVLYMMYTGIAKHNRENLRKRNQEQYPDLNLAKDCNDDDDAITKILKKFFFM